MAENWRRKGTGWGRDACEIKSEKEAGEDEAETALFGWSSWFCGVFDGWSSLAFVSFVIFAFSFSISFSFSSCCSSCEARFKKTSSNEVNETDQLAMPHSSSTDDESAISANFENSEGKAETADNGNKNSHSCTEEECKWRGSKEAGSSEDRNSMIFYQKWTEIRQRQKMKEDNKGNGRRKTRKEHAGRELKGKRKWKNSKAHSLSFALSRKITARTDLILFTGNNQSWRWRRARRQTRSGGRAHRKRRRWRRKQ